jgi:glycosyltransferase involved in cell wall biosynthesis
MSHYRFTLVMPSASRTGGAEESFCQLLKSDAAQQVLWQVIFLEEGPLVRWASERGNVVRVVASGRTRQLWQWWRASGEIKRHAKEFSSDLIFGWMTKGQVYGGLAAWRSGIDAAWFQMGLPEHGMLDRASRLLPAKAILACSKYVAELQRQSQPLANVISVPLGVDVSRFSDAYALDVRQARTMLNLPTDRPIVGIVGRLQRWKGMHVLIDAMSRVVTQVPDALCLIVGGVYPAEPEYPSYLCDQIERLGLEGHVLMVGAQDNVPLWMKAMDIFVHASDREPFGIVVVEGLYLGKTVIATTPGGPEEIIQNGINGFFAGFGDSESLATRVVSILSTHGFINPKIAHESSLKYGDEAFSERVISAIQAVVTK